MGTKAIDFAFGSENRKAGGKKMQNLPEQTFMFVCAESIFKQKAKQWVTEKIIW